MVEISQELYRELLDYLRVQAEIWHGISGADKQTAIKLMHELIEANNVSND